MGREGGRGRRAQERFFWAGGNASPYSAAPLMGREEEEAQSATNMRKRGEKIITGPAEILFCAPQMGGRE